MSDAPYIGASAAEIRRAWQAARDAVTDNYVSEEAWDAIEALDKLVDSLPADDEVED